MSSPIDNRGSVPNPTRYAYIDALRGYAVLGVIATHCAQHVSDLATPVRWISDRGRFGVQLFFVVSAVTLLNSWLTRADGACRFYARRLFRIAPIFWLAIPVYLSLGGYRQKYWAPEGISRFDVISTACFSHGWYPSSINSVVPGGWSIAVEMTFYLFFPLLMIYIRSIRSAAILAVVTSAAVYFLNPIATDYLITSMTDQPEYLVRYFTNFWFPNQLPVFLIGFVTCFAIRGVTSSWRTNALAVLLLLTTGLSLLFFEMPWFEHIQFAIWFAILTFCLANMQPAILVNRVICRLGQVSFSAYLIHFVVIDVLMRLLVHAPRWITPLSPTGTMFLAVLFVSALAITAVASELTYRFIEKPMIALGHKTISLIPKWQQSLSADPAPMSK